MKAATLVLLSLACAAQAEPITLKGLRPGMTKAELEQQHPGFTSRCMHLAKATPPTEICGHPWQGGPQIEALATLAGATVERWHAHLRDGTTHTISVTMKSADFERVRAAMEERWGKPSKEELGTVTNRMGARFDQAELWWKLDGSVLFLRKRSSNLDKMSLLLGDEASIAQQGKERREVQPKQDAKDM